MSSFCDIVRVLSFRENVSMEKERITLTKNELKRVMVLEQWIDGHLTEQEVARSLGLSVQQAYRKCSRHRSWESGP